VRPKAKPRCGGETSSREEEIHHLREKRAQRDKPKGRKGIGEMHSIP